jgi:hypothetical protein
LAIALACGACGGICVGKTPTGSMVVCAAAGSGTVVSPPHFGLSPQLRFSNGTNPEPTRFDLFSSSSNGGVFGIDIIVSSAVVPGNYAVPSGAAQIYGDVEVPGSPPLSLHLVSGTMVVDVAQPDAFTATFNVTLASDAGEQFVVTTGTLESTCSHEVVCR